MFGGFGGIMRAMQQGDRGASLAKGFMDKRRAARASGSMPMKPPSNRIGDMIAKMRQARPMQPGQAPGVAPSPGSNAGGMPAGMPKFGGMENFPGKGPEGFGPPGLSRLLGDKLADTLPGRMGQIHTQPGAAPAPDQDARMAAISAMLDRIRGMGQGQSGSGGGAPPSYGAGGKGRFGGGK